MEQMLDGGDMAQIRAGAVHRTREEAHAALQDAAAQHNKPKGEAKSKSKAGAKSKA